MHVRSRTAGILVVPLMILVYLTGFILSMRDVRPDSAKYPMLLIYALAALAVVCTVVELLKNRRSAYTGTDESPPGWAHSARRGIRRWAGLGASLVLLALYRLAIPVLGFYVATALFVALLQVALRSLQEERRISFAWILALAPGVALVCYLFFERLLELPLPSAGI
jgi:putative tricarboxylic transport membrane protein